MTLTQCEQWRRLSLLAYRIPLRSTGTVCNSNKRTSRHLHECFCTSVGVVEKLPCHQLIDIRNASKILHRTLNVRVYTSIEITLNYFLSFKKLLYSVCPS